MDLIIENMNNVNSLNSIWISMGLTEFSFLFCLKVAFFLVFLSLNICLFYIEFIKNKKINTPDSHLKATMIPEYKQIASQFAIGLGIISSIIAVKNEYLSWEERKTLKERAQAALDNSETKTRRIEVLRNSNNFSNRLHITSIKNSFIEYNKAESEVTELRRLIKEKKSSVNWGTDKNAQPNVKLEEAQLQGAILKQLRAKNDLDKNIATATKYTDVVASSTETEETKFVEKIINNNDNDDIHNSAMFNLDYLWSRFEAFDGLTKIACIMMFSSSIIIAFIFGIAINLYGNFLLNRFQLEEKYPKVAIFIKYRQKISKYYILSNMIYIVIVCLMNLYCGISIIGIIYT